ncbi:MAG: dinitrogenase reductase [Planctomycetaceae bacterium]|nr:dinitrogenase reductase [Planctomycetaceae bacterium]
MNRAAIVGCLLGTAVGDALGLPYENLTYRRAQRLLGEPDVYRLIDRYGLVSDDTEHSCVVAQAMILAGNDEGAFTSYLGRQMRRWFWALPTTAGMATLRAGLKLSLGMGPTRSGVFSAGNGPAMRSAILGVAIEDLKQLRAWVSISTRITHTDPKADYAAFAVALAAHDAAAGVLGAGTDFVARLRDGLRDAGANELFELVERAVGSVQRGESTREFAMSLGLERGVTGYCYHTVPVALHAAFRYQGDMRRGVPEVIRCGGDTDSMAAIVGGILGAEAGRAGIPAEWLHGIIDRPRTVDWMERLAGQLAEVRETGRRQRALRLPVWDIVFRNAVVLIVVLAHGFRRVLPPY